MSNYTPRDQQARGIKTWQNPAELQTNEGVAMPTTRDYYELQMYGATIDVAYSYMGIAKNYNLRDSRYTLFHRNPVLGTKTRVDTSKLPSAVKRDRFPKVTPASILADRVKELRALVS